MEHPLDLLEGFSSSLGPKQDSVESSSQIQFDDASQAVFERLDRLLALEEVDYFYHDERILQLPVFDPIKEINKLPGILFLFLNLVFLVEEEWVRLLGLVGRFLDPEVLVEGDSFSLGHNHSVVFRKSVPGEVLVRLTNLLVFFLVYGLEIRLVLLALSIEGQVVVDLDEVSSLVGLLGLISGTQELALFSRV